MGSMGLWKDDPGIWPVEVRGDSRPLRCPGQEPGGTRGTGESDKVWSGRAGAGSAGSWDPRRKGVGEKFPGARMAHRQVERSDI